MTVATAAFDPSEYGEELVGLTLAQVAQLSIYLEEKYGAKRNGEMKEAKENEQ